MKKTIAILLVAILAVSSVFAAFSGKASVGFGANLDNGNFGFIDKSANVGFDVDLATASAEQIAEGDVYASIKATFGLKLLTGEKKYAEGDPYVGLGGVLSDIDDGRFALAVIADITEAKVAGENWYVSILGLSDAPNFAESAIDTYTVEDGVDKYGMLREDFDKAYNYGVAFEKAPGVEVGVFDYVFGVGVLGDYSDKDGWKLEDNLKLSLYAKTPEYNFGGVNFQVGGVYSYSAFDKLTDGVVTDYTDVEQKNAVGLSAKVGFANDIITANVAADMGFNLEEKGKDAFDMDLAANFGWNFITVDAYYATRAKSGEKPTPEITDLDKTAPSYKDDVLSFQAKFDLNSMNVPVAITASVKDVLKTVELGVSAEVTAIENLTIKANAGYVVDTMARDAKALHDEAKDGDLFLGQWKVGADVEYDFGFAKVAAGVSAKNIGASKLISDGDQFGGKGLLTDPVEENNDVNRIILGASASISTDTLIPGATLKLAWENADDLLGIYKVDIKGETYNLGKITASCAIEF